MIRVLFNGWLFGLLCALLAWAGFSMLDTWLTEREARAECGPLKTYRADLVRVDGVTRIRCDRRLPIVRGK